MNSGIALVGPNGQVGRAIREICPEVTPIGRDVVDFADLSTIYNVDWSEFDVVINAAAYTAVDQAEQEPELARRINAHAVGVLAERLVRTSAAKLIHFSSDYVFDGTQQVHGEDESPNPLSVYGSTKNMGDALAKTTESYIIRTSWVVGDGKNFVRTMLMLAREGVDPPIINDQFGRLTFARDLASFALFLAREQPDFGVYNLSSGGQTSTWFDVAAETFSLAGYDRDRVTAISTEDYFKDKPHAARPRHSTLSLDKVCSLGITMPYWNDRLAEYIDLQIVND